MEIEQSPKVSAESSSSKFGSRKFLVIAGQGVLLMILPIVYHILGISDSVSLAVMVASSALAATYTGVNVLDQHLNGIKGVNRDADHK